MSLCVLYGYVRVCGSFFFMVYVCVLECDFFSLFWPLARVCVCLWVGEGEPQTQLTSEIGPTGLQPPPF